MIKTIRKTLLLVALSLPLTMLQAQCMPGDSINPYRIVVKSTLHGIARIDNLDTYLSGYSHKGYGYHFNNESFRKAHIGNYEFRYLTRNNIVAGYATLHDNMMYMLKGSRSWNGYHPLHCGRRLQLLCGAGLQAMCGALYMPGNGNNPVSAKLHATITASGIAIYRFNIANTECTARYILDIPITGVMFSPEFGQSYYEIFGLGDTGGTVKTTNPIDCPSWQHTLSADIPIATRSTLRIAYIGNVYQTRANSLRTHIYSHTIALGFVRTIYKIKNNDPLKAYRPY